MRKDYPRFLLIYLAGIATVLLMGQTAQQSSNTARYIPAGQTPGGVYVMDTTTGAVRFMAQSRGDGSSDYGKAFHQLQSGR